MHNLFYSDEQYREYCDEVIGPRENIYAQAYRQSRIERPLRDERDYAAKLYAQGYFVVVAEWEVCCPVTDGLIGYEFIVQKFFTSRHDAEAYIGIDPDDRCEGVFLYESPAPAPAPLPIEDETDEIPF